MTRSSIDLSMKRLTWLFVLVALGAASARSYSSLDDFYLKVPVSLKVVNGQLKPVVSNKGPKEDAAQILSDFIEKNAKKIVRNEGRFQDTSDDSVEDTTEDSRPLDSESSVEQDEENENFNQNEDNDEDADSDSEGTFNKLKPSKVMKFLLKNLNEVSENEEKPGCDRVNKFLDIVENLIKKNRQVNSKRWIGQIVAKVMNKWTNDMHLMDNIDETEEDEQPEFYAKFYNKFIETLDILGQVITSQSKRNSETSKSSDRVSRIVLQAIKRMHSKKTWKKRQMEASHAQEFGKKILQFLKDWNAKSRSRRGSSQYEQFYNKFVRILRKLGKSNSNPIPTNFMQTVVEVTNEAPRILPSKIKNNKLLKSMLRVVKHIQNNGNDENPSTDKELLKVLKNLGNNLKEYKKSVLRKPKEKTDEALKIAQLLINKIVRTEKGLKKKPLTKVVSLLQHMIDQDEDTSTDQGSTSNAELYSQLISTLSDKFKTLSSKIIKKVANKPETPSSPVVEVINLFTGVLKTNIGIVPKDFLKQFLQIAQSFLKDSATEDDDLSDNSFTIDEQILTPSTSFRSFNELIKTFLKILASESIPQEFVDQLTKLCKHFGAQDDTESSSNSIDTLQQLLDQKSEDETERLNGDDNSESGDVSSDSTDDALSDHAPPKQMRGLSEEVLKDLKKMLGSKSKNKIAKYLSKINLNEQEPEEAASEIQESDSESSDDHKPSLSAKQAEKVFKYLKKSVGHDAARAMMKHFTVIQVKGKRTQEETTEPNSNEDSEDSDSTSEETPTEATTDEPASTDPTEETTSGTEETSTDNTNDAKPSIPDKLNQLAHSIVEYLKKILGPQFESAVEKFISDFLLPGSKKSDGDQSVVSGETREDAAKKFGKIIENAIESVEALFGPQLGEKAKMWLAKLMDTLRTPLADDQPHSQASLEARLEVINSTVSKIWDNIKEVMQEKPTGFIAAFVNVLKNFETMYGQDFEKIARDFMSEFWTKIHNKNATNSSNPEPNSESAIKEAVASLKHEAEFYKTKFMDLYGKMTKVLNQKPDTFIDSFVGIIKNMHQMFGQDFEKAAKSHLKQLLKTSESKDTTENKNQPKNSESQVVDSVKTIIKSLYDSLEVPAHPANATIPVDSVIQMIQQKLKTAVAGVSGVYAQYSPKIFKNTFLTVLTPEEGKTDDEETTNDPFQLPGKVYKVLNEIVEQSPDDGENKFFNFFMKLYKKVSVSLDEKPEEFIRLFMGSVQELSSTIPATLQKYGVRFYKMFVDLYGTVSDKLKAGYGNEFLKTLKTLSTRLNYTLGKRSEGSFKTEFIRLWSQKFDSKFNDIYHLFSERGSSPDLEDHVDRVSKKADKIILLGLNDYPDEQEQIYKMLEEKLGSVFAMNDPIKNEMFMKVYKLMHRSLTSTLDDYLTQFYALYAHVCDTVDRKELEKNKDDFMKLFVVCCEELFGEDGNDFFKNSKYFQPFFHTAWKSKLGNIKMSDLRRNEANKISLLITSFYNKDVGIPLEEYTKIFGKLFKLFGESLADHSTNTINNYILMLWKASAAGVDIDSDPDFDRFIKDTYQLVLLESNTNFPINWKRISDIVQYLIQSQQQSQGKKAIKDHGFTQVWNQFKKINIMKKVITAMRRQKVNLIPSSFYNVKYMTRIPNDLLPTMQFMVHNYFPNDPRSLYKFTSNYIQRTPDKRNLISPTTLAHFVTEMSHHFHRPEIESSFPKILDYHTSMLTKLNAQIDGMDETYLKLYKKLSESVGEKIEKHSRKVRQVFDKLYKMVHDKMKDKDFIEKFIDSYKKMKMVFGEKVEPQLKLFMPQFINFTNSANHYEINKNLDMTKKSQPCCSVNQDDWFKSNQLSDDSYTVTESAPTTVATTAPAIHVTSGHKPDSNHSHAEWDIHSGSDVHNFSQHSQHFQNVHESLLKENQRLQDVFFSIFDTFHEKNHDFDELSGDLYDILKQINLLYEYDTMEKPKFETSVVKDFNDTYVTKSMGNQSDDFHVLRRISTQYEPENIVEIVKSKDIGTVPVTLISIFMELGFDQVCLAYAINEIGDNFGNAFFNHHTNRTLADIWFAKFMELYGTCFTDYMKSKPKHIDSATADMFPQLSSEDVQAQTIFYRTWYVLQATGGAKIPTNYTELAIIHNVLSQTYEALKKEGLPLEGTSTDFIYIFSNIYKDTKDTEDLSGSIEAEGFTSSVVDMYQKVQDSKSETGSKDFDFEKEYEVLMQRALSVFASGVKPSSQAYLKANFKNFLQEFIDNYSQFRYNQDLFLDTLTSDAVDFPNRWAKSYSTLKKSIRSFYKSYDDYYRLYDLSWHSAQYLQAKALLKAKPLLDQAFDRIIKDLHKTDGHKYDYGLLNLASLLSGFYVKYGQNITDTNRDKMLNMFADVFRVMYTNDGEVSVDTFLKRYLEELLEDDKNDDTSDEYKDFMRMYQDMKVTNVPFDNFFEFSKKIKRDLGTHWHEDSFKTAYTQTLGTKPNIPSPTPIEFWKVYDETYKQIQPLWYGLQYDQAVKSLKANKDQLRVFMDIFSNLADKNKMGQDAFYVANFIKDVLRGITHDLLSHDDFVKLFVQYFLDNPGKRNSVRGFTDDISTYFKTHLNYMVLNYVDSNGVNIQSTYIETCFNEDGSPVFFKGVLTGAQRKDACKNRNDDNTYTDKAIVDMLKSKLSARLGKDPKNS